MIFQESETIELKEVVGLNSPDEVSLQINNMVKDSIKLDVAIFLHYQTIEEDGKEIVIT